MHPDPVLPGSVVSKIGHCLNDLLFRYRSGLLPVEIPAIVSNHMEFYQLAASYNIPFRHLPLEAGAVDSSKLAQEARIIELLDRHKVDLVVLARYMQILAPSFKGARSQVVRGTPHTAEWRQDGRVQLT
jgi:formyltetrahydrofolate deformylase